MMHGYKGGMHCIYFLNGTFLPKQIKVLYKLYVRGWTAAIFSGKVRQPKGQLMHRALQQEEKGVFGEKLQDKHLFLKHPV